MLYGPGDVPPAHVGAKAFPVDLGHPAAVGAQRLQLGAEHEQAAEPRPIERLDADPIARQVSVLVFRSQTAKANMPLSRSSAAATPQSAHASTRTSLSDCPRNTRPEAGQLEAQLRVVVDLPVVDQDEAPAGREHWLRPAGERSRIANRRCASEIPAAGSTHTPQSSGPRWRRDTAIAEPVAARPSARNAPRVSNESCNAAHALTMSHQAFEGLATDFR
jgi:hypothetical protein